MAVDDEVPDPEDWPVWLALTKEGEPEPGEPEDDLLTPPTPVPQQVVFLLLGLCVLLGLWGVIFFSLRALRVGQTEILYWLLAGIGMEGIGYWVIFRHLDAVRRYGPSPPGDQSAVFLGWLTPRGLRLDDGALWEWESLGAHAFSRGDTRWFCVWVRWVPSSPRAKLVTRRGHPVVDPYRILGALSLIALPLAAAWGTFYGWHVYGPRLDVGAALCAVLAVLGGRATLALEQRSESGKKWRRSGFELLFDTRIVSAQDALKRLDARGKS